MKFGEIIVQMHITHIQTVVYLFISQLIIKTAAKTS